MSAIGFLRRYLPAVVGWLAVVVVAVQLPVLIRAAFVVAAAAWVPGAAVAWVLESTDRLERGVLIVALSLCISTIVAVVLSSLHSMTGLRELAVLAAISTGALGARELYA